MALPILIGAAALKGIQMAKGAHDANKQNKYLDAADEADFKRGQADYQVYEKPKLHSAEQQKTFGNNFALGFLSNFGRAPGTGEYRAPWFKDMADDAWKYRDIESLSKMHSSNIKGPKRPQSSVLGNGLLGAGMGAAEAYLASKSGDFGAPKVGRTPPVAATPTTAASTGVMPSVNFGAQFGLGDTSAARSPFAAPRFGPTKNPFAAYSVPNITLQ